jgi:uncharacterized MAPEG superfamily protein
MSIEMWSVFAMSAMLVALVALQGTMVPVVQGLVWGLGARDEPLEKSRLQRRIARTVANHIEAVAIFVPLMGLVIALGLENEWTARAAWLVIGGRLAFIPLYLMGVFALRSIAFGMFLIGVLITIFQLI